LEVLSSSHQQIITCNAWKNQFLAQLSYDDLEQLYLQIPKLERFFRIIIQKAYVATQKRLINNLSLPAKERYLQFLDQYPLIEQRVPQYMIASYSHYQEF
jgi:hypothetical protein